MISSREICKAALIADVQRAETGIGIDPILRSDTPVLATALTALT